MIIGIDFSLTSPGCVILANNGKFLAAHYCTQKKKYAKDFSKQFITHTFIDDRKKPTIKDPTEEDVDNYKARRLEQLLDGINIFIKKVSDNTPAENDVIGLEGYAMGGKGRVFDIAEATGCLKNTLYWCGYPLRIHDPLSIKIWATGRGNAKKFEMVDAVDPNQFDVPLCLFAKGSKLKKPMIDYQGNEVTHDVTGPGADLCDAYHIAKLLWAESYIRQGYMPLSDLEEHQRKVFLRVTKTYPINLLDRPFVQKGNIPSA